ncbi:MAG: phospholipase A [Rhodocyclaceae bacterium]|nr:phospholipase A [Rhodocyclaceae bacterium]MCP5233764.1 phospholipase A [Zoogloeaceae bacterium]
MKRAASALLLVGSFGAAHADNLEACKAIVDDARRLACYDEVLGRVAPPADTLTMEQGSASPASRVKARDSRGSSLSLRWELEPEHKRGTFLFRPYKPVYMLPLRWSDNPNRNPRGYTERNTPEGQGLKRIEAKFQISFKAKLLESVFGDNGDLWFGYTQQANWQVYDKGDSAPFRESVYEPEFIAVWRTDIPVLGLRWRMLSLGFNHQSNGKTEPASRSWNRIYAEFGLEGEDFALLIKPWVRLPENEGNDDNRDIQDYIGRGELTGIWKRDGHVVSLGLRHSLRAHPSRGAATLDWAFPIRGYFKGHLQLFTGYGETLIDYNHRQTVFGLGVSLAQWL